MQSYPAISRDNNFDLVRLFAALQVVFFHVQNRMDIVIPGMDWFRYLTGVPIFFTVSGFLISASYVRNRNNRRYFVNRALRIYPAIYALIVITTIAALACGDLGFGTLLLDDYRRWIISWVTIDQNFTPPILRTFGIGTPNGSLWTIPVELTFYLALPFLFKIKKKNRLFLTITLMYVLSLVSNYLFHDFQATHAVQSVFSFSLLPYLHYFLAGAVMYMMWDRIRIFIEDKFFCYFVPFVGLIVCYEFCPSFNVHPEMTIRTISGVLMNILLALCTISAAFSFRRAARILHGNDLSYGIYLYHGLVINVLIECCDDRSWIMYPAVYIISIVCAWFSWRYVEKPCLALKQKFIF